MSELYVPWEIVEMGGGEFSWTDSQGRKVIALYLPEAGVVEIIAIEEADDNNR